MHLFSENIHFPSVTRKRIRRGQKYDRNIFDFFPARFSHRTKKTFILTRKHIILSMGTRRVRVRRRQ